MSADRFCITQVASTVDALLEVPCHGGMAPPLVPVLQEAAHSFSGPCDRVFLYNPDAIAQWIYAGHRPLFAPLEVRADLGLGMLSVYPPVTPACFASMYSGLQPAVHGIQSYVKPVLTVDTIFDDLPQAGRQAAIVSTEGDSISLIFGVIFETPIVLVALTGVGLVKPKTLQKNFKYVVLIILIVAAVITPPDVTSQVLVAIPLMILFYASIILCKILFRRKLAEQEEDLD